MQGVGVLRLELASQALETSLAHGGMAAGPL